MAPKVAPETSILVSTGSFGEKDRIGSSVSDSAEIRATVPGASCGGSAKHHVVEAVVPDGPIRAVLRAVWGGALRRTHKELHNTGADIVLLGSAKAGLHALLIGSGLPLL